MMRLIEAVPNLSEGRNFAALDDIQRRLNELPNLWLLGVDSNVDAHRSVFTMVGTIEGVEEGLLRLYEDSIEHLDMTRHQGVHPRIGAVDVCPLVPLGETTHKEAEALVRRLAKKIWEEFEIPVSFYQKSAKPGERENLAYLRRGGFEGLPERLATGFQPDVGEAKPHPKAGMTIMGVRDFLIAYNINLGRADLNDARQLATKLRHARDREQNSNLQGVDILGWYLEEHGLAQISCNVRDYLHCGIADVFFEVKRQALDMDIRVTGSEIVGMLPIKALVMKPDGDPKLQLAQVFEAALALGLDDFQSFDPQTKIIEYRLKALGGPNEI